MVHIKGKTIIYTAPASGQLGQVSPYLLVERLADELVDTWPQLKVNKVFATRKQGSYQIYCVLPTHFTNEQIRLVKLQIELIACNLLAELKDKIYNAWLAS